MSNKIHIGDRVYVKYSEGYFVISQESGENVIAFGSDAWQALKRYAADSIEGPAPTPTWSKDAPSEPGHYWFRPSDLTQFKQVVQVSRNVIGNLRASVGGGAFYAVEELKGLWWSERLKEPGGER